MLIFSLFSFNKTFYQLDRLFWYLKKHLYVIQICFLTLNKIGGYYVIRSLRKKHSNKYPLLRRVAKVKLLGDPIPIFDTFVNIASFLSDTTPTDSREKEFQETTSLDQNSGKFLLKDKLKCFLNTFCSLVMSYTLDCVDFQSILSDRNETKKYWKWNKC